MCDICAEKLVIFHQFFTNYERSNHVCSNRLGNLCGRIHALKVAQNLGNFKCSVSANFWFRPAHARSVRVHEQSQVKPLHKKERFDLWRSGILSRAYVFRRTLVPTRLGQRVLVSGHLSPLAYCHFELNKRLFDIYRV